MQEAMSIGACSGWLPRSLPALASPPHPLPFWLLRFGVSPSAPLLSLASMPRCQVFHPAIDTEGHVDMSLLGADWRPDMCVLPYRTVPYCTAL